MSRTAAPRSLRSVLALLLTVAASVAALPAVAQPTFSKVFQPDTIGAGSTTALVFSIDNQSGTPVDDMAFTDILPAGVTLADPVGASNGCGGTLTAPAGGDTIALSGGQLATFSSCQIRVDVTSSTLGVHTNTSGDLTSDAGNSGPASDDLNVFAGRLGFSKSFSPSTVQLGGRSTLTFVIDNGNDESAKQNLVFSDTLPAGLLVAGPANVVTDCPLGASGAVVATPGTDAISYSSGLNAGPPQPTLAGGASCSLSVDVVAGFSGRLDNRSGLLTYIADNTTFSNGFAVASLQVDVDELALTKSFTDDPVAPGGTVNLRFSITNFNRNSSATGITFSDDLNATLSGLAAVPPLPTDPCGAGSALSTAPLTLTGGTLAAGETCVFDVSLQVPAGATPGVYPNTTSTVSGDVGGAMVVGSAASDDLFVQEVPLLTKTFLDPGTLNPISVVEAGDEMVIELTATNGSTSSGASDVEFSDNLTAFMSGLTVTALPPAGACGSGSIVFQTEINGEFFLFLLGGDLPNPGDSCTFQVTVLVPPGTASGPYVNQTSEITATVDGDTVIGPPASADITVLSPPSFLKTFQSGAPPGGTVDLEFTLNLTENAPTPATGITFTDDLDATLTGLTAIGLPADGFCGPGSQMTGVSQLSVTGASLDPGTSCSFQVTLQVPAGAVPGDYLNTTSDLDATVGGVAVSAAGVTDTLRVIGLQALKSFPDSPAVAGGTATLRFTLDNSASPLAASAITFSDDLGDAVPGMTATVLPADGFCGAGSQMVQVGDTLSVVNASLAAGASCTFDVTVQVPDGTAADVYINVTSLVTATVGGEGQVLPAAGAELEVIDPLSISKSFIDDPVAPGETVTLELTLTNDSPTDGATGLTFSDDLDAALSGMTAIGVPADGFCGAGSHATGGGVLTVTGAELAPSSSCTFQVTVQVPAGASAGTTVVNTTSQLSGLVGDVAATAPPASDVLRIDLVELTKSFSGPVGAGGTVVLSFQIDNRSVAAVSGLGFTDDLDATLSGLVAVSLPSAPCGAGSSITGSSLLLFNNGSLPAGGTCSFDVTVQVPAGAAPGVYPNTTSELISQGQPVGTAATADLQVEPAPQFDKSFSPTTVLLGDVATLSFEIDNSASVIAADGLAFTDDLPAGLEVAAPPNVVNGCGGTFSAPAGATSVALSAGSVAAGGTCTVQVPVIATGAGSLVNVSGALTSSLGDSGTASATVQALALLLTFEKAFLGQAIPGGTIDLQFTLTNGYAEPLSDVSFSDDLDAALPGLEAVGLPAADVCGAGSQLSGTSVITLTGGSLPASGVCSFTVTLQLPQDLPSGLITNVTSPVSFTREGVRLEGDTASADLPVNPLAIPTLGFWGLLLLAGVLAGLGWLRLH